MKERERALATGLTVLLLVLWLGFLVHRSPRFAGTLNGSLIGIAGAVLMFVPLVYMVVKRNKRLKRVVTKRVSMRTLLAWHIYAGLLGPILVLIHTGHKFESPLGIALTAMTLIVVISGFVGRYLMRQLSAEIREKKATLKNLQGVFARLTAEPRTATGARPPLLRRWWYRLQVALFESEADAKSAPPPSQQWRATQLAESIADVEYAIKTHEKLKHWFRRWQIWHITVSFVLYFLLLVHVSFAVYFGLRWWS